MPLYSEEKQAAMRKKAKAFEDLSPEAAANNEALMENWTDRLDFIDKFETMMGKVAAGREVLDYLEAQGTNIVFTTRAGMAAAYMDDDNALLVNHLSVLNQAISKQTGDVDESGVFANVDIEGMSAEEATVPRLISTVAHEAYHKLQAETKKEKTKIKPGYFEKYDLLSSMGERFKSESGADAFAALLVSSFEKASDDGVTDTGEILTAEEKRNFKLAADLFKAAPTRERVYEAVAAQTNSTDAFQAGVAAWQSNTYALYHLESLSKVGTKEISPEELVVGNFPTFDGGNYYDRDDKKTVGEYLLKNQVAEMVETGNRRVPETLATARSHMEVYQQYSSELRESYETGQIGLDELREDRTFYTNKIMGLSMKADKLEAIQAMLPKPLEKARDKVLQLRNPALWERRREEKHPIKRLKKQLKNWLNQGDKLAPDAKLQPDANRQLAEAAIDYVQNDDRLLPAGNQTLNEAVLPSDLRLDADKAGEKVDFVSAPKALPPELLVIKKGVER